MSIGSHEKPCPFCRETIHAEAIKCRFCNEMLTGTKAGDRAAPTAPTPPKARRSFLATLGILAIGAVVVYLVLPSGAKDAVNVVASRSGIVGRAVPWAERADTLVRRMLDGNSGARAAASIQVATHPTGGNPRLVSYDVTQMGDRLAVRISVSYQAATTAYTIVVLWEFSERGHISTTLVADDSFWPASTSGVQRLDDWFKTSFYPPLYSNTGG